MGTCTISDGLDSLTVSSSVNSDTTLYLDDRYAVTTPTSATIRYNHYDSITTCIPISRHRRIYRRKLTHCTCCNGLLPAMECNDSTELKCPYCDSMQDAVEIIDEEY